MDTDFKVLYRKYRPKTFDEIVGQKFTIRMLKNAIIKNKISHAYLFTGPRGTGKTSTAKIFAKTINCEHPENGIPCGTCASCLNINNNADIIEIDAASNNGVDEIREIINHVKISPSFSKYKVYIIDEVHMLSQSAFNALLLTLEEPPSHVVFILATTNVESVPITILSRCQRYDFKKLSFEEIEEHLKYVSNKENITITDEAIKEIAYLSEGGLRDALSILNQLYTSSDSITGESVIENYGSVSYLQIEAVINAFLEANFDKLEELFNTLKQGSFDYKIFIKKLIDCLYKKALEYKRENEYEIFQQIKDTIFELNDVLNKININIDPFILVMMVLSTHMNSGEITKNLNKQEDNTKKEENIEIKLEKTVDIKENNKILEPEKVNSEEKKIDEELDLKKKEYLETLKKVRINNCLAEANKNYLNKLKEDWERFVDNVNLKNDIKYLVIDALPVVASEKIGIFTLPQVSIGELFNNNLKRIENEFNLLLKNNYKFLALSVEEWTNIKNDYIIKLKNNYVYQILEEPVWQDDNLKKEENTGSEGEINEIFNIFDKDKIEIR